MLESPTLQNLKKKVDRLHQLLSAPKEGCFTWNAAVASLWKELAETWKSNKDGGVKMFKKILATAGLTVGAHIPVGILILGKCLLSPVGFWQNLVFFGAGVYLLGGLQIVAWVFLIICLLMVWTDFEL